MHPMNVSRVDGRLPLAGGLLWQSSHTLRQVRLLLAGGLLWQSGHTLRPIYQSSLSPFRCSLLYPDKSTVVVAKDADTAGFSQHPNGVLRAPATVHVQRSRGRRPVRVHREQR
jgi:hypothetical protein